MTLWLLGYPDQGRGRLQRALAQAQAIEQPASVAFAHLLAGIAHLLLDRDMAAALSHAQALRLLGGVGLEYDGAWAEVLAGQAQAAKAGFAVQAPGSGVGYASQLLVQAQMYARAGQAEMGLEAMDRALAWLEHTGVRVMEAEVWRMRGELLLRRPLSSAKAEACFRRALEVAREQQARWLELRAAVSLARLWHTLSLHSGQSDSLRSHDRRGEARELLSGLCSWFTEGLDAVDLVEARALLEKIQ